MKNQSNKEAEIFMKNTQKSKTGAYYIRVSTNEQAEYSPESQKKKILEYAEKNNIFIPEEFHFEDIGISGRNAEKRPQFMEMINTAKKNPKPFDIVLVWKFSRFARNREDSIVYKKMLRVKYNIEIVSVSEYIGNDPMSSVVESLIESMDEFYSNNLSEEVKRGMNEKFSRGGIVSPPPFGYIAKDGIFVPDEYNAPVVRMIYEWYMSGMSTRSIAIKLNEMGIVTKYGNKFENRTVEYILTNPVYTGKLRKNPNGRDKSDRFHQSPENVIINSNHEPIISEELFKSVNEKLHDNKKKYVKHSHQTYAEFMLKGLVRCSNCNSTLVQSVKGKSLQCHKYSKGQCNVSHSILIESINEAVIDKLESDLGNHEFQFEVRNINLIPDNINDILLKRENEKLERAKQAYLAGIDSIEEYSLNKKSIENKIKELKSELPHMTEKEIRKTMETNLSTMIEKIRCDKYSENEKNILLKSIISCIIFDRKNLTIQIKYHSLY